MSYPLNRIKICDGIFFNSIIDKRYKTNRISVNVFLPLNKDDVTVNAIVPFILRKGSADFPDFSMMNKRLYELYGTFLDADVNKTGDTQIINLSVSSIDNAYTLNGENLIKDTTDILCSILLKPNFLNGEFLEEELLLERKILVDLIESEINEKRSYAVNRLRQIMCENEPYGINKYGFIEKAKTLDKSETTIAYKNMIRSGVIEIMFTGCGDPSIALECFKKAFENINRENIVKIENKAIFEITNKEKTEYFKVNQSKMVMGFRTKTNAGDDDATAVRLLTAIYGGTPFSRLFVNVREKLSLCYYCAARFDKIKGILIVDCGVESGNIEKAKNEIINQLDIIKRGEFSDEEFSHAVLSITNSLKTVNDSTGAVESWYLAQICYGTQNTPEDEAQIIKNITREAVIQAANKIELDTVYVLTGGEEGAK